MAHRAGWQLGGWLGGWLAAAAVLALAPAAYGQTDRVLHARGHTLSGTIIETSPTEIRISATTTTHTVPVNEIQRLLLADEPNELRRARDAMAQGRLEDARAELDRIDAGQLQRPLVREEYRFLHAAVDARLALARGGDRAAAAEQLHGFAMEFPSSHNFLAAAELLGDLSVAMGNFADAVVYYASIDRRAPWPDVKLRSVLLEARARLAQGDYQRARERFESIIASPVESGEIRRLKQLAQIGQATCLAALDDPAPGIELVEQVLAAGDPQDLELFGRAYNALGRCHVAADQPTDALLAFLHVDLLFVSRAHPDVHAEALHRLVELWTRLNRPEEALRARGTLQNEYAGSYWSRQQ